MINNNVDIIIGQLNFTVGDIEGNTKKIIGAIKKANKEYNADIIVFPELSISSYPPEDLLLSVCTSLWNYCKAPLFIRTILHMMMI